MARKTDYDAKIKTAQYKIEKHQEAIKALKTQLKELETLKAENDYKELLNYMKDNDLSTADVISRINPEQNEG